MFKTITLGFMISLIMIFAAVYLGLSGWLSWKLINLPDYGLDIKPGSLVITRQSFKLADVRAGDVVSFSYRSNNQLLGRVTKITNDGDGDKYLLNTGEAGRQYSLDGASITGRAVSILPWLGRVVSGLMSWPVIVVGLYIPAVTIIGYELNRFARHLANYSTGQRQ